MFSTNKWIQFNTCTVYSELVVEAKETENSEHHLSYLSTSHCSTDTLKQGLTNQKCQVTSKTKYYVVYTAHFLIFHIFKNQQNEYWYYNNTDHKKHFLSGANSYMFWHQGAIHKEFLSSQRSWVQLFAHTCIIKVKILKILKFYLHIHIAATPISAFFVLMFWRLFPLTFTVYS